MRFMPAISARAVKTILATIRSWRLASTRNNRCLEGPAHLATPSVRGWLNYLRAVRLLEVYERASIQWLGRIACREPQLFVLWQAGVRPEGGS